MTQTAQAQTPELTIRRPMISSLPRSPHSCPTCGNTLARSKQNKLICSSPICLKVYRMTDIAGKFKDTGRIAACLRFASKRNSDRTISSEAWQQ